MILKKLSASFGKLNSDILQLDAGLNIIQAPNEAGKSTWCSFIKSILFGINTSERDKAGYLSDKTRFAPWSGAPMEGSAELEYAGHNITIQRLAHGKTPMRDFSAVYTGTSEAFTGLSAADAGTLLTGMTEPVFVRSAFIRQAGLPVDQSSDLEKRISSLISTGEESTSYSDASQTLRGWLNKRRHNRTGLIPATELQLAEVTGKLDRLEKLGVYLADLRDEKGRLAKHLNELERQSSLHDEYDKLSAQRRLEKGRADCEKTAAAVESVRSRMAVNGVEPSDDDVAKVRGGLEAVSQLTLAADAAEKSAHDAKAACAEAENELNAFSASRKAPSQIPAAVLSAAAALCVIFAIFGSGAGRYALSAAAAIAAAAACVLFVKARRALLAINSDAGKLKAALDACNSRAAAETSSLACACSAVKDRSDSLVREASACLNGISAFSDIPPAIAEYEKLASELRRAENMHAVTCGLYKALVSDTPEGSHVNEGSQAPSLSRDEIKAARQQAQLKLSEVDAAYNRTVGEMQAVGDPLVLGGMKNELSEKLRKLMIEYKALETASAVLSEAYGELQARFSPLLSRKACEICSRLTGGKYSKLTFDRHLNSDVLEANGSVSRNILQLSAGTSDQIYLSLRLAICELSSDSNEPCPIILDDALANFDDARVGAALDYLVQLSQTRQIILFTCHSREGKYVQEKYGITAKNL